MKIKLTLQEKLRDLRDEKKLTLSDLARATSIPLSTLQRMEGKDDYRAGYPEFFVSPHKTARTLDALRAVLTQLGCGKRGEKALVSM